MVKQFTKANEYRQQERGAFALVIKADEVLKEARQTLGDLRKKHATLIRESTISGEDVNAELDTLETKIAEAEKLVQRKQTALDSLQGYKAETSITKDDVVATWNTEYVASYRAEVHDPLVQKMYEAKKTYLVAALAMHDSIKFIETEKSDVINAIGDGYRYKLNHVGFDFRPQRERVSITHNYIETVDRGVLNEETRSLLEAK